MRSTERRNLFYNGIYIELTRQCNLACAHCLRGSAQNKTMTRDVIDKLIQNIDFVKQVYTKHHQFMISLTSQMNKYNPVAATPPRGNAKHKRQHNEVTNDKRR